MFLGACTLPDCWQLVTEKCESTLQEHIRNQYVIQTTLIINEMSCFSNTNILERMRIAKQVSEAMRWLHEVSKLAHRDLKPENLLVTSCFVGNLTKAISNIGQQRKGEDCGLWLV